MVAREREIIPELRVHELGKRRSKAQLCGPLVGFLLRSPPGLRFAKPVTVTRGLWVITSLAQEKGC